MAEGGSGRSRSFWVTRYFPGRRDSSRVCKFYAQGNCYYADRCRFRHVDSHPRTFLEAIRGERNGETAQRKDTEESNTLQTSANSEEERLTAVENDSSAQGTNAEPLSSSAKNSNEVGIAASNSQGGSPSSKSLNDSPEKTSAGASNKNEKAENASDRKTETAVDVTSALSRSKDKACGICFDVVLEKSEASRKFGILPNCNHCFCLDCIRKWRRANDFDSEITRACPECRVTSDFICPSFYWVDSQEEKDKLIKDYKESLSERNCRYFLTRNGRCPFGEKCFYKHTNVLSSQGNGHQPFRRPFRRRRRNVDVEITVSRLIYLWDFLVQDYDSDISFVDPEEFESISILSDSDESNYDWSFSGEDSD